MFPKVRRIALSLCASDTLKCPKLGRFESVQAALTDIKKSGEAERAAPAKEKIEIGNLRGISCDDLWDWERGEPTALARRFLTKLKSFRNSATERCPWRCSLLVKSVR